MIQTIIKKNFTGALAIAASAPIKQYCRLLSVTLKLNGDPGVETLTITLNANAGAAYDVLLLSQAMSGVTSLVWQPDSELKLEPGDSIDVALTNAAGRTYGLQVTTEAL